MDTATARPTVFISYNGADRTWAEWIAWALEEDGYKVVIQAWDFRPGSNFVVEMDRAAAGTDKTVLVLSDNYLRAEFTHPEWAAAFARDPRGLERRVVPVQIAPCSSTGLLAQVVPVDLFGLSESAARQRLLQAFAERGKPAQAPAFPVESPADRVTPAIVPFPGGPPLHNLPYPRLGDLFTGRQEELDALSGSGTAAITQSTALSGLGGIGKTRLAVEYAWRSGNRYTAAWFLRADSPESLRRNLAALAGPELMSLPEWEARVEESTIAAVKRWLRERPGWLMILDNVDTPEAARAVLEVLPSLYIGRVLITSRLTTWPATVRRQSLDTLSREEAVAFLLHRTEGGREPAEDDAARAADLAERVDGLPLALEQVAAFIIRHRMRFAEYLRAWEQERDNLLQWYDPLVMQYPASVAVTWKQTFDRLSPTPAALLRLTAFLAPDPIPFEMLDQGAEHVKRAAGLFSEEAGMAADGKSIREATADLADYSLITRQDGRMLVVHRMVQEALRSQIPEEQRRVWIEGALRVVNAAAVGHPGDVRTWPIWSWLRPHAIAIVATADQAGIGDLISRLMNELAQYLYAKALYVEAEPWMRRALSIDEETFGKKHPHVAIRLNNLAQLLQDTNRLKEAEPLMRRALHIDETSFGKEHPNVAIDLHNLARLLQSTNRLGEAEPLMQRALHIDETSFGKEHPNVTRGLNNLATLLQDMNRLGEAEPLMRRALHIDETSFGKEHPTVATRLNNLAMLLQDTNRLGEAEPLMRRAVDIWERSLGLEHPRTRLGRKNLTFLLAEMAATASGEGGDEDGLSETATAPG